jgi:hypothetical protein
MPIIDHAAEAPMQALLAVLTIVFVAACGDSGPPPLVDDQVRVRFPAGGVVDVLEIQAVDRLPLRKAELIAPDGQATSAAYLAVNPSPSVSSFQGSPNGPYAGDTLGVGNIAAGVPLPALTTAATQQRTALLAMVSFASIPLPDPIEYRRDWQNYRVRLSFGEAPGEAETREVTVPAPPAGG